MELFKFTSDVGSPFRHGVALNGLDSVMWIERYREPGEFKITGLLSSGIRHELPLGTFISHTDTKTVMIVEDHNIKESLDKEATIEISGRSFETILENRIVGSNLGYNNPVPPGLEYTLMVSWVGDQAHALILDHMQPGRVVDPGEEIPYVVVSNQIPVEGEQVYRTLKRQTVHKALIELLAIYDYGVKAIRKPDGTIELVLHKGVNRASSVGFSWKYGELANAEYLWTSRKDKNVAYVKGRYVEEFYYTPGADKMNRRVLLVDAADLDDYLDTTPTGSTLDAIRQKMYVRGQQALRQNNEINIAQADVADSTQYKYRIDYNIGDIVQIDANYGTDEIRRVVEFTEIEDENGESAHPSFETVQQGA